MKHLRSFPFKAAANMEIPSVQAQTHLEWMQMMQYLLSPREIIGMKKNRRTRTAAAPSAPRITEEHPTNTFDQVRDKIEKASKNYTESRDAWKKANEELATCRPQSAGHPSKVSAAALALNTYLGAAEELQQLLARA